MQIGMIGLGRMGGNMALRLIQAGHSVVGYNRNPRNVDAAVKAAIVSVPSVAELVKRLKTPRAIWLMVPHGKPTEESIDALLDVLAPGDIIVDGGNSRYTDSARAAERCAARGVNFLDVGVSGGVWGREIGYCLMIGGPQTAFDYLEPVLAALAPKDGYALVGASGAGHFVKMVHNGIEYGMMEAFGEGFEIMQARKDFSLDLHQVAEIWRVGSVVRSWLLDLTADALKSDQELSEIAGYVSDSGEGRWTVFESIDLDVPAPVITLSLQQRFVSRQDESYAAKLLAAMRNQFGGHAVKKVE